MAADQYKILVVDDQIGIRRLLEEVLMEDGYDVCTGANGFEAVEKAEVFNPDLILMDMKMPGMDGLDALQILHEKGWANKVMMMTAYGELELVNKAKAFGACAYVTKPFDIIKLCSDIKDLLTNLEPVA